MSREGRRVGMSKNRLKPLGLALHVAVALMWSIPGGRIERVVPELPFEE